MNNIVFCALRDNKGATGGPGGVLFLQKEILGHFINGYNLFYQFNFIKGNGYLSKFLNTFFFIVKYIFWKDAYFVTHDVRTAVILTVMKKKYSLIFHHQGPLVEELLNLGVCMSEKECAKKKQNERIAFLNAHSVHFPSKGAEEMYFKSEYSTCKRDEVNVGEPLYNTIPSISVIKPHDFYLEKAPDTLTFFSLGTLTSAKGQDQSIDFLKKLLEIYKKNVRYIMVGKGPLKDLLIEQLEKMKSQFLNFDYYYYESLSHDIIMYLHEISDVYLMIHRISIFDFATLEAMSQSSAVVLSKIGGNLEFNYDNNIIFAEDVLTNMSDFVRQDLDKYKKKNKKIFEHFFSREAYKKQYEKFIIKYVK